MCVEINNTKNGKTGMVTQPPGSRALQQKLVVFKVKWTHILLVVVVVAVIVRIIGHQPVCEINWTHIHQHTPITAHTLNSHRARRECIDIRLYLLSWSRAPSDIYLNEWINATRQFKRKSHHHSVAFFDSMVLCASVWVTIDGKPTVYFIFIFRVKKKQEFRASVTKR